MSTPPASPKRIVGKALKDRRDDVVLATKFFMPMGDETEPAWWLAPLDHAGGRGLAPAPGHRLHRPLPGAPARPGHRRRGDPRRPDRPRPPGQGPLHRVVVLRRQPDRGGPVDRSRPAPAAVRHRAAALLDPGARHRGRRAADRAPARHGHPDLQPARPAGGCPGRWRKDAAGAPTSAARPGAPVRHDQPCEPAQARDRRGARAARRTGRDDADRAGDRVRRSTTQPSPLRSSGPAPWNSSTHSSRRQRSP